MLNGRILYQPHHRSGIFNDPRKNSKYGFSDFLCYTLGKGSDFPANPRVLMHKDHKEGVDVNERESDRETSLRLRGGYVGDGACSSC